MVGERCSKMIFYTDNKFDNLKSNPFNNNLPYNNKWIMLKLIESAEYASFTGGGKDGLFHMVITKENPDWHYRIYDFIQYEESHGNNIIIAVNQDDLDCAKLIYNRHSFNDNFLRPYEPNILLHCTSKECYQSIMSDSCLKSWNTLKLENKLLYENPIGELLGDPIDYRDYIMFTHSGKSAERVVSSRQKGYIDMDFDSPYVAGARFYFDADLIAKDGLLIRDGVHLKVKDALPIEKYLLWIATPEALRISENTTPRIFAEKADEMFSKKFNIELQVDIR